MIPDFARTHFGYTHGERRSALYLLASLAVGDRVRVASRDGQEHEATVTGKRYSDGEFGSRESLTIHASLGPGRYTYDLTAHRLASGELSVQKI